MRRIKFGFAEYPKVLIMQTAYSKDSLYKIAADNYGLLREYTDLLVKTGYWKKVASVVSKSAFDVLDSYVQTCMTELCLYNNSYGREEASMIAEIPDKNVFGIIPGAPLPEKVSEAMHRIYNRPPTLIQLFGVLDRESRTCYSGMFYDALLNILLSVSGISKKNGTNTEKFLNNFYGRTSYFLFYGNGSVAIVDEKYMAAKLTSEKLFEAASVLRSYGPDFIKYKVEYLRLKGYIKISGAEDTAASAEVSNSEKERPVIKDKISTDRAEIEAKREMREKHEKLREAFFSEVAKNSELKTAKPDGDTKELEKLVKELDSLVGLDGVKAEVKSLINLIKVKKMREKMHLPEMEMTFHMVFTGSPGTGKTTVARLIAAIYRELGLLTKGQLVETDRTGLVAGYIGQTALKVKDVVDQAIGGVLFIDEAYSLSNKTENDFGKEAIDTLVKLMEDNRKNLVVIVAGYTDEMKEFLRSNTGLVSRFNKFLTFRDYSDKELVSILKNMAEKSGYALSEDALEMISENLGKLSPESRKRFGNARGIRNIFEKLVCIQANRVVGLSSPDRETLSLINSDDTKQIRW